MIYTQLMTSNSKLSFKVLKSSKHFVSRTAGYCSKIVCRRSVKDFVAFITQSDHREITLSRSPNTLTSPPSFLNKQLQLLTFSNPSVVICPNRISRRGSGGVTEKEDLLPFKLWLKREWPAEQDLLLIHTNLQSRTQSPWAFWSLVGRLEGLWDNGIESFFPWTSAAAQQ